MTSAKRLERLKKWNEERLPALERQLFEGRLERAAEEAGIPLRARAAFRQLREAQERAR